MSRRHRRSLVPVVRAPHWPGLAPHVPAAALRPSRYYQPCPHHRSRPGRRPTTTATFASSRFSRHRHSLSARLARSHFPCRSATPLTHTPFLSRPLEDCEGCPALAGVRNLRLDDPSAGCSDLHRNFGVRSIWARRAAAARRAGSLERGCTGRTVRRAEWQALAECVAPGGDHAATGARSWQASQASGAAALAGRRARTRTRRAGSHPPRSPIPASARTTPGSGPHRAGP